MKSKQGSSDALPYAQVDRAVKAKAATLAGRIGVTYQHALGTLLEFWEINGEPRALERLVEEGKTEVLLTRDEVEGRFLLASGGKAASATDLASLGLLEQRNTDLFRIRGMSRFFDPIVKRLKNRESASKGGSASAETRKERYGTAQPTPPIASASASASAQAIASTGAQAIAQAESKPSDQRSAISDQRKNNDLFPEVVPIVAPRELSDHEVLFSDFCRRRRDRLIELEQPPIDEEIAPAFVNAIGIKWKRWFLDNEKGLGEYDDRMSELLIGLVADFLALDWPAAKSPPFPFKMLASEKVWLPIAEKLIVRTEAA